MPEQHGRGVHRWQHGLCFDPSLELFVQPLDRVGGANAAPLAWRQMGEGEEPVAGFLQAVGDGAMLEPRFADEGLPACLDLLARRRIDRYGSSEEFHRPRRTLIRASDAAVNLQTFPRRTDAASGVPQGMSETVRGPGGALPQPPGSGARDRRYRRAHF